MAQWIAGEEKPLPPGWSPAMAPASEAFMPGADVDRANKTVMMRQAPEEGTYREDAPAAPGGMFAGDMPPPAAAPGGGFPAVAPGVERIVADRPSGPVATPKSDPNIAAQGLKWIAGEESPLPPDWKPYVPSAPKPAVPARDFDKNYNTILTPDEEMQFQAWKQQHAPQDSGEDYDLRGAFKKGLQPGENGHWSDEFKKPNHETFSNESRYAKYGRPGRWNGEEFIPPETGKMTRGMRNNNPGNIEQIDGYRPGEIDGTDKRFASFETPEAGIAAIGRQLMRYQSKRGIATIPALVETWAPKSDGNNTAVYSMRLGQALGIVPEGPLNPNDPKIRKLLSDTKINISDPETLRKLTAGIIQHENGWNPYSDDTIDAGVNAALRVEAPTAVARMERDPRTPDPRAEIGKVRDAMAAQPPMAVPPPIPARPAPAADPRTELTENRNQMAIKEVLDRHLTPAGVGETALAGMSYLIAAAPASVAALMAAIDQKDPQAFAEAFADVHDKWSYHPQTKSGKYVTHSVGQAFSLLGKVGDFLGDAVMDPNIAAYDIGQEVGGEPNRAPAKPSPVAAALFKAAPELLGLLPGMEMGRGTGRTAAPEPPPFVRQEPTLGLPRVPGRITQADPATVGPQAPPAAPPVVPAPPVEVTAKAPSAEEAAAFEKEIADGLRDPKTGELVQPPAPAPQAPAAEAATPAEAAPTTPAVVEPPPEAAPVTTPAAVEPPEAAKPEAAPVLVYHGTQLKPGAALKTTTQGQFGPGIYTTTSQQEAGKYSTASSEVGDTPNVVPLHISLKNPLVLKADVASGAPRNWFKKDGFNHPDDPTNTKIVAELKAKGYDGIIATQPEVLGVNADGSLRLGDETTHYVAFSPESVVPAKRTTPAVANRRYGGKREETAPAQPALPEPEQPAPPAPELPTERWQWQRNKEGGQTYGNAQRIVPLDRGVFDRFVAPKLKNKTEDFDAYREAHPNVTHVSLVNVFGKPQELDGVGTLEELRPPADAIKKGWAKQVDSLHSEEAKQHGASADSETAKPAAPLPVKAPEHPAISDFKAWYETTGHQVYDTRQAALDEWLKHGIQGKARPPDGVRAALADWVSKEPPPPAAEAAPAAKSEVEPLPPKRKTQKTAQPAPPKPEPIKPAAAAKPVKRAAKAARDPGTMTNLEINRELEKLREQSSQLNNQMIEEGRGHERPSDLLEKTDPLSMAARATMDRLQSLHSEARQRYGPDYSGRLGKGGARIKAEPGSGLDVKPKRTKAPLPSVSAEVPQQTLATSAEVINLTPVIARNKAIQQEWQSQWEHMKELAGQGRVTQADLDRAVGFAKNAKSQEDAAFNLHRLLLEIQKRPGQTVATPVKGRSGTPANDVPQQPLFDPDGKPK